MKSKSSILTRGQRGFTLIELLAVVAIIGLLAALIIPSVANARKQSQVTATVADLNKLAEIVQGLDDVRVFPVTTGFTVSDRATILSNLAVGSNLRGSGGVVQLFGISRVLRFDQVLISLGKIQTLFTSKLCPVRLPILTADSTEIVPPDFDPRWNNATMQWYNTPDTNVGDTYLWDTPRLECSLVAPLVIPGQSPKNYRLDGVTNLPAGTRVVYAVLPSVTTEAAFLLGSQINGEALMDSTTADSAQVRGKATWAAPTDGRTTVFVYLHHQ